MPKSLISLLIVMWLVVIVGSVVAWWRHDPVYDALMDARERYDPATAKLEPAYNTYVQRAFTPDWIKYGVITFADGDRAKYWFHSHHLTGNLDDGGTIFERSDGTIHYVRGLFCCEVQLPDTQLRSTAELLAYIDGYGHRP